MRVSHLQQRTVYSQVCSTYTLVDMRCANARLVHIGTYGPGTSGQVRCLVGPKALSGKGCM